MNAVMIGVDPAKRSHAIAVLAADEEQLAALQIVNDTDGYAAMMRLAKRWSARTWAVEGAGGVGVQLAQRLVADGETVLDVPPKLATRARIFDVGHGRKNDPGDARTVAVVALRTKNLRLVTIDDEMLVVRLLSERRTDLVDLRTSTINHLHQLLMELIPAGAERKLTATKAKSLLATVRPRTIGGRTRRRLVADLIEDIVALDKKIKDLDKRLKEAAEATGTTITTIKGIGITTAALILGEVGDVRRFPSSDHFATYSGTAPREVSSGEVERHRLSRAGNRRLNYALHVAAMVNARTDDRGRAYYVKKVAAGKGKKGAMRCLKDGCPTPSSTSSSRTRRSARSGARVGKWGRLFNPAWPTHTPMPALRSSHTPGSDPTLRPSSQQRLDIEGSRSSWRCGTCQKRTSSGRLVGSCQIGNTDVSGHR